MPAAFDRLRFTGTWRPYQARVLAELDAHMDDDRVHIVAPSGSGKTLVGLEAVRRMGRPALILAPTVALCDQWLDRWTEHFSGAALDTSRDLRQPATLTIATYQALHAAHTVDSATLSDALCDVGTLVADEAHHLRKAWWETLRDVHEAIPGLHVVALTATPPYDVPSAEWKRYAAFCGLPDAEITTPELVRAGHLCPHLDVVHLSVPDTLVQAEVDAQREAATQLAEHALNGPFARSLAAHPWIEAPDRDAIADGDPEWFVSALTFLHTAGHDVSWTGAVLGIEPGDLPALRLSTVSHVLQGALRRLGEFPPGAADAVRRLGAEARRIGAMHGRRVLLHRPPTVRKALGRSTSKIESVAEVVAFEAEHRGGDLRAVVLADRIHEEVWEAEYEGRLPLGVAPLVSRLQRLGTVPVAALNGAFVALPEALLGHLQREVSDPLDTVPVTALPGMVRVTLRGDGTALVRPMTRLFEQGEVRALVGTVALLGEGWDAPAANVLVAASYAATFVQTGQMRGRVLRVDASQPNKVATVWHLACVEPGAEDGGPDLARLARRFAAFAGPRASNPPQLETGTARLSLPAFPSAVADVEQANATMYAQAISLSRIRQLWREAVGDEVNGHRLRPLVRVPTGQPAIPPGVDIRRVFSDPLVPLPLLGGIGTLGAAAATGLAGGLSAPFALALGTGAVLTAGTAAAVASWRAVQRRAIARTLGTDGLRLRAVAEVVLSALAASEVVSGGRVVIEREPGIVTARLLDASTADSETFATALAEIAGMAGRPRYLLRANGVFLPVPTELGRRKDRAETFATSWRERIGPADLVFTRTPDGRRHLAEARARWSTAGHRVETVRRWS
ncbi:MAG: DEAD/DEAH box helicase family protein [Bacteroidota bacterium]